MTDAQAIQYVQKGQAIDLVQSDVKSSGLAKMRVTSLQGKGLHGEITVSGAKNAALKHMCASILTDEPFILKNMPNGLQDVRTLSELLNHLGVTVGLRKDGVATFHAQNIKSCVAPYDLVRKMRASVLVLGPLLARHGEAIVSLPGGCALGARPIDLHLKGLEAMGAEIELEDGYVKAKAPAGGLKGADITFPVVSVGATENIMMAATLANGKTILRNAAQEPEIVDQGQALIKMGAKIEGLGTSEIQITGVDRLHGATHEVVPDRIEAGTYLCAVGLCGGEVTVNNVNPEHLSSLIAPLRKSGLTIEVNGTSVTAKRDQNTRLKAVDIDTNPYPGFATDLQSQFMVMMTLSEGSSTIRETIFENRFMHVPELCRMGADITIKGNAAIVRGVEHLTSAEVMATDLRASVAMVLAGLVADGETIVNRIYHLDRGYENIVEKLMGVGATIERVK